MTTNPKSWLIVWLLFAVGTCSEAYGDASPPTEGNNKNPHSREHGSIKTISIGHGESISFVWIAPMNMWIGQFEITNGQYRRYDPEHDSQAFHGYDLNGRNYPVVNISWENARNYCSWLNRYFIYQIPNGYSFRLPTEMEWETFASAGENSKFPWGSHWPPPGDWNYRGAEGVRGIFRFLGATNFIREHRDNYITSTPVYQSGTNKWSLYGTGGNVWELCQNWFDEKKTVKSVRGASWSNYRKEVLELTNRASVLPDEKTDMIGFRVVIGK